MIRQAIESYFEKVVGPHHRWLTVISVLMTVLAVVVVATQWNINNDFRELLPGDSEAGKVVDEVGERVGSGSTLFVVIDSPERQANRDFAEVYAEELRAHPDIALAHYHNDRTFFEEHKLLYVDREDLLELNDRIRSRMREERQRQNPLFVDLSEEDEEDEEEAVDTRDIEERYEDLAHQDYREYLEADDGYSLTIMVRFGEGSTDLATTRRLLEDVRRIGEELDPPSFHEEMYLEFGGGLVNRDGQYSSILTDVVKSALFTIIGLFLVISLYFRRFRAVGLVLIPLVMAVVWTFALAFLIFGELTTITIFVFAILLGLGIDFSIHLLNGYDRERLDGRSPIDALRECYQSVGRATVMGGTTTFATFVVLSFAQFRGLAQFGQVSAIGVAMMVLAMVVTLPGLILTLHERWPHAPDPAKTIQEMWDMERWYHRENLARVAPWMLGVAVVLIGLAVTQIPNLYFEENFRRIGDVETPWQRAQEPDPVEEEMEEMKDRAASLAEDVANRAVKVREAVDPETFVRDREQLSTGAKYTSALSRMHSSTPTLLLLDDMEQAFELYWHMHEMQEAGELESVRSITSVHAFMPGDEATQKERLEAMEELRETLEEDDLRRLSDEERADLEELRDLLDVNPVTVYDLPDWAKRMFMEAGSKAREPAPGEEFAFEYILYVNERIDHMVGEEARQFLGEVQKAVETSGVDARVGSQAYIYTTMLDEIQTDGAKMLGIALVVVFLLMLLYFRSPVRAMTALIPLTVGTIWMLGFAAWFGIKLDFFNVIILPVIIGIGIDDGLHFYHRYLDMGEGSILDVGYHVGSAVGMTTVTSMIGFGGLAITDEAGLQSIGYLAFTGLGSAFLATILIMPALLWVAEQRRWTWILPKKEEK